MIGRIRTFKPALFQHDGIYDLEASTAGQGENGRPLPLRLAFLGLLPWVDRAGLFEWKPAFLKLNILPYDKVNFGDVLDALERGGFIVSYTVAGRRYGWVPTFLKHQSINSREAASTIPPPPPEARAAFEAGTVTGGFATYRDNPAPPSATEPPGPPEPQERELAPIPAHIGANVLPSVRKEVFERDGHRCVKCGATDDLTLDHIRPRSMGGNHDKTNLRTYCRRCNSGRPVVGPELEAEIEAHEASIVPHMQDTVTHMHAQAEGKGMEGNGREGSNSKDVVEFQSGDTATARPLPAINGKRTVETIVARLGAVVAEVQAGTRTRLAKKQLRVLQAEMIFQYWATKHGHERTILDDKRERLLCKRLEENDGDVSELFYTTDGALRDRAIQGEMSDSAGKYDGVETIFRDRAQVERLARITLGYRKGITHPLAEKYAAAFGVTLTEGGE